MPKPLTVFFAIPCGDFFSPQAEIIRKTCERQGVTPDIVEDDLVTRELWDKITVRISEADFFVADISSGSPKFRIQPEHVEMRKAEDAKNPAKGYGVSVAGQWYWYQNWADRCIELCRKEGDKLR